MSALRAIRRMAGRAVRSVTTPLANSWGNRQPSAVVLIYHRVAVLPSDRQLLAVAPDRFRDQVRYLAQQGCVIPLASLAGDLERGEVRPGSVVITFDDGYADNFLNARPILEEHGVPATVFVTGGNIASQREFWWDELERMLFLRKTRERELELELGPRVHRWPTGTEAEVASAYEALHPLLRAVPAVERDRALDRIVAWSGIDRTARESHRPMTTGELAGLTRKGVVSVGAHTMSHGVLAVETPERQRWEIHESRSFLEGILQEPVRTFSYPFGTRADFSDTTVRLVREEGFACSAANWEGRVFRSTPRFEIPRFLVRDWPLDVFVRALEGFRNPPGVSAAIRGAPGG